MFFFSTCIDDGVRVCVGLAKFQLLRGPQKGIFKQKEQSDPNFVEGCVDIEVAHLSSLTFYW